MKIIKKPLKFLTPREIRAEAVRGVKPHRGDLMNLVELVMGDPRNVALANAFEGVANELLSQSPDLKPKVPLIKAALKAVPPGMKWLGRLLTFQPKKASEVDEAIVMVMGLRKPKPIIEASAEAGACAIALCLNAGTWWKHCIDGDWMEEKRVLAYTKKLGQLLEKSAKANEKAGSLMPTVYKQDS